MSYMPYQGNSPLSSHKRKHARPLLCYGKQKAINQAEILAGILEQSGLSHKNYNIHSFRIGAATTARQAGIPDAQIQMLGRWQSNAYKQYIKTPREELARLSKQLISNGNRTDSTSS